MQRWLKANGGGLALALFGVALTGFKNPYVGGALIFLGVAVMVFQRLRPVSPREVVGKLDASCRVVIAMRGCDATFELPTFGKGFVGESMYGRISVAEARTAIFRLEQLGVLQMTFSDVNRTEYRWTDLGEKVKKLMS